MASMETRTRKDRSQSFRVVWREEGLKHSDNFANPEKAKTFAATSKHTVTAGCQGKGG